MKPDHFCSVGKGARAESFRLANLTARAVPTRSVAMVGTARKARLCPPLYWHAAAMLHCVRDTGTATCNPVNYRAGTGALQNNRRGTGSL